MRKIKDFKKKDFKKLVLDFITNFKNFLTYNRQFFAYTILSLISCWLLRIYTIGKPFLPGPFFFDLSIILLIGSFAYLFKPKKQHIYLQVVMIVITIMNIVNAIYYSFFSSYASFSLLESLGQATEVTGAVWEKLKVTHFIYIIFPIILLIINKMLKEKDYFNYVEKIEVSKRVFLEVVIAGGIILFINIACLSSKDISRFSKQWNREYIVERFGIVVYQGNDLFQTIRSKLSSIFGKEEAYSDFEEYYEEYPYAESKNKYTNIFDGYNVVVIHMESIMNFLIGLEINGEEVTPNLNKLVKDSMYFDNFYAEQSTGTSSDSEFTFSSSLMPVQMGTVNVSYFNREYVTLQSLLKEKGYYTFSMHGNKASMWNRNKMHPSLGYTDFYSQDSYNIDEVIGLGLSDKSFFTQSETKINDINTMVKNSDEYTNWMGTLITLSNHTPFDIDKYMDESELFDVTYHTGKFDEDGNEIIYDYLEGTTFGNYIKSAHYADECLGEYIEYVKSHDEYKNTMFIMYGDHAAQLSKKQFKQFVNYNFETGEQYTEEDENYVDYDYYANELFKKVPLIIWTTNSNKNKKIKGTYSYPMGMIDVLPTVANMLNIDNKYQLGHDIFEVKNNNMIVFPNGNFLTNKVYYYNSKNEYKVLDSNYTLDEEYIDERKKKADKILEVSNEIIVFDLIKKERESTDG